MDAIFTVDRRDFLRLTSTAAVGLVIGCRGGGHDVVQAVLVPTPPPPKPHDFGAFVQIDTAGNVGIWVSKSDMGQGVRTALPMLVAEELDVDWSRVKIYQADLDAKYGRQGTGGSSSIRTLWEPLRKAGATARAMIVAAAAAKLGDSPANLRTEAGFVVQPATGTRIPYGELVEAAAAIPVPTQVALKDPKEFRIIGQRVKRVDNADTIAGKTTYGIDIRRPNMLYGAVARPSVFGARVARFDDAKARAIDGVRDIIPIDPAPTPDHVWGGVGIIAENTWAALKARDALVIEWDNGSKPLENTDSLRKSMIEISKQDGKPVRSEGDAVGALAKSKKKIAAEYETPFLAHATMEPMNATAEIRGDELELWAPTQFPDWAGGAAAKAVGLDPKKAKVHVTMLGGGFGRRAQPDYAIEAAILAKKAGAPVKVTWTREDDMQHDYYRPMTVHRIEATLGESGLPDAWRHRIVSTSIDSWMNPASEKPEQSEVGGADDLPYRIPNLRVEFGSMQSAVPRGWWRSVESSFNAFVVESFVDEMAAAAKKDPVEFRLALLGAPRILPEEGQAAKQYPFDTGRLKRVLELAASKAGWGSPLPAGMARGVAIHRSFLTYVAEVSEVSVSDGGEVKVHRVVCAVDCGLPVNPDGIEAQMESGIVYGLTAALKGEITIKDGAVEQSNFHDYPLLTIAEMPKVEVHIVKSTELPTGTGEPGLPPIAPAVTNAIFALTGKRVRKLPIRLG